LAAAACLLAAAAADENPGSQSLCLIDNSTATRCFLLGKDTLLVSQAKRPHLALPLSRLLLLLLFLLLLLPLLLPQLKPRAREEDASRASFTIALSHLPCYPLLLSLLDLSHSGTHGEVTPFDTFFQVATVGCCCLLAGCCWLMVS